VPASYQIEPQLECIFVTLQGTVTDEDLIEAQRRMFSEELFQGRYARLIDATNVTRLLVTAGMVRAVSKAAVERGVRKAALVASSDVMYGMMRMYEGYASEAECQVFRNTDEALGWLFNRRA
jgi:SpoIIAA-like